MSEKQGLLKQDEKPGDRFEEENQVTWTGELKQTGIIILSVLLLCAAIFVIGYFFASNSVNGGLDSRLQGLLFAKFSPDSCRANLKDLTSELHMAGTNASNVLGDYIANKFTTAFGKYAQIKKETYHVLLSYPSAGSSVQVLNTDGSVKHTAQLFENQEAADPQTQNNQVTQARGFVAYSPKGTYESDQYYYVNYGREEDYALIKSRGINLTGSIVIARYGKAFRGIKVQLAEKEGAKGILIFSDPQDDGFVKGRVYPDGEMRSETSIQRGSIQYLNIQPGDATTPNGPSLIDAPRIKREDAINLPQKILAQPISARDAKAILSNMGGDVVPADWVGALPGITYRFGGAGNGNTKVKITVETTEAITPVTNVFAIIKGEVEPDRQVLVGNHRDAWTYGGVDPHSGTIAMLEFAKGLGYLINNSKWRPRRTMVFASWDAEEYGLIGSTEWVEHHRDVLKREVVAYLNVDTNSGKKFNVASSPTLASLIREEANKIQSPNYNNMTLAEEWNGLTSWVGSGSDDSPFFHHLGVPSASMSFDNEIGVPGVYHSLYETNYLMSKFVDPEFTICTTSASIWSLVAVRLAHDDILSFNVTEQSTFVSKEWSNFKSVSVVAQYNASLTGEQKTQFLDAGVKLELALDKLTLVSTALQNELSDLKTIGRQGRNYEARLRIANDKAMGLERAFAASSGLKGREWYKHVLCAPSKQTGYGSQSFPGIIDAIRENNFNSVLYAFSQVNNALGEL